MLNDNQNQILQESRNKKISKKHLMIILIIGIILIIIFAVFMLLFNSKNEDNNYTPYNPSSNPTQTIPDYTINKPVTNKIYGFDENFIFDNLEITIGSNYTFDIIQNRYSEYNNSTVLKIPITVKNNSSSTHGLNMFYYDVYGSLGTEIKTVGSYFDDDIDYAGDLRSGASYTKYINVLYDGNGIYSVEFNNYLQEITVEFNIVK